MLYQIEFVRHVEDKAEFLVLDAVRLIGDDNLAGVVAQAKELFHWLDILPRPDGFRIRGGDGEIVHEHHEFQETEGA